MSLYLRKGQSSIEMAMAAILVILALIAMGPYVLRSINSQFKLWDSSVSESFEDQVPDTNVVIPVSCDCHWQEQGCGVTGSGCQSTERLNRKVCNPTGCDTGYNCTADESCCTQPQKTSVCWRSDVDSANHASTETIDILNSTYPGHNYHYPCTKYDRVYRFGCGANAGQAVCVLDTDRDNIDGDRDCTPICRTDEIPANVRDAIGETCPTQPDTCVCPGTDINLSQDTDIYYTTVCPDPGAAPHVSPRCQVGCPPGFFLINNVCKDAICGDNICHTGIEDDPLKPTKFCCKDCPSAQGCTATILYPSGLLGAGYTITYGLSNAVYSCLHPNGIWIVAYGGGWDPAHATTPYKYLIDFSPTTCDACSNCTWSAAQAPLGKGIPPDGQKDYSFPIDITNPDLMNDSLWQLNTVGPRWSGAGHIEWIACADRPDAVLPAGPKNGLSALSQACTLDTRHDYCRGLPRCQR